MNVNCGTDCLPLLASVVQVAVGAVADNIPCSVLVNHHLVMYNTAYAESGSLC